MEGYRSEHGAYTDHLGDLREHAAYTTMSATSTFPLQHGVSGLMVTLHPNGDGWSATAAYQSREVTCTIYAGAAAAEAGVEDGEPQCEY